MARVNVVSHDHLGNGGPPNKGIKSPSKLLSPKYQSQSSLGEQNRNNSSPTCVHFVNTITFIIKEEEPNVTKKNDHSTIEMKKVGESKSYDIKRDDLYDRACGEKEEVDEVDEESDESKKK
ncbi:hypothetical protein Tco_1556951 [Tanacetum coccineum]